MFNRNPRAVESMNICVEGKYSIFAKIFEATKKFSQALEEEKTSDCQVNVMYLNFTNKRTEDKDGEVWGIKYD